MLHHKRSRIFQIWSPILAVLFLIGGIILGFAFKTTEYSATSLFGSPMAEQHFNWTLMFITWFMAIPAVLFNYAIYAHLDYQEQILAALRGDAPAETPAVSYPTAPPVSPAQVSASWQCKICGTENEAENTACEKCGWSAQPEK